MTEKQLLAIITNGYMGDPCKGYGKDYVDYKDEINQRYWELQDAKRLQDFEDKIDQLENEDTMRLLQDHYMTNIKKLNFSSEADLFLSGHAPREIEGKKLGNKNTYEQYRRGLSRLMEFMIANNISDINAINLEALVKLQDDMLHGYKAKTVQTYMGVVKEFFYFLQNRGVLKSNEFSSLRTVGIDRRSQDTRTLNESEVTKVMAYTMAMDNSPNRLNDKIIMLLLVNTGLREEELTNLKVGDFVLQDGHLVMHIRIGKGMRRRFITLSKPVSMKLIELRNMLENALMMPLGDDDYLIQSLSNNYKGMNKKPINRSSIFDRLKRIASNVEIDFSAHALRRTLATLMYKRGTPIEVIQRMLGHENVTTTQAYIDLEVDKDVSKQYSTSLVG